MGGTTAPPIPVLFLKPASSIVYEHQPIEIPSWAGEIHHEIELGIVIGRGGKDIPEGEAMSHIAAYVLSIDVTARDLQAKAKEKGLPWSIAKGLDTFTPVSSLITPEELGDASNVEIWLKVDGEERQRTNTSLMVHNIASLVSFSSSVMTLEPGDLILTGTPSGVGRFLPGQKITAGITDIMEMAFDVVESASPVPRWYQ